MVEAIANLVRAFPADRARNGQPFVALELISGAGPSGRHWSGRSTSAASPLRRRALDAAISAAYPDVRLGRRARRSPLRRPGAPASPAT